LAQRGHVTIRFDGQALPLYEGALAAARAGVRTGGDQRNRSYVGTGFQSRAEPAIEALSLDPQTSGGLLAAVDPADAPALLREGWWEVGEVTAGEAAVEVL
jgi:selenide,water dikinase